MKSNPRKIRLIPAALFLAVSPHAGAAVLAEYTFSTGAATVSTDVDANSTAGAFNISGGSYPVDTSTSGFSASQHVFIRSTALTSSTAGAITNNDYATFTLTPNSGTFDLTSITVKFGGSSDNNGAFNVTGQLRTSLDGFASNVGSAITHTVPNAPGLSLGDFTIDLSSLADVSGPIEFRLYLSANTSNSPQILRFDDVVLNGDLIPEPTSTGLAALTALALIARRKRK